MTDIQEMLIEKYLFTKAPAGPHHNSNWSCIDCKNKLEGKYDFYPYCISCKGVVMKSYMPAITIKKHTTLTVII